MCGGIEYQDQKIYFPQLDARLPVRLRDGHVTWITWGRCKDEATGKFPNGGWARLNSIKSGKWKPCHPRPVLIAAVNSWKKTMTTNLTGCPWIQEWRFKDYWQKETMKCGFTW